MKMRYRGSNPWIGKGVHEVEVVWPWTESDKVRKVYVMDIRPVRMYYYDNLDDFGKDWEEVR